MTLLIGVLIASVVGSLHCAAMCGGFVCAYSGMAARPGSREFAAHAAYHAGRLISYVTLGLLAGTVGARVDSMAELASIERGAAMLAGLLMIIWAAARIAAVVGRRVPQLPGGEVANWVRRQFGTLLLAFHDQPVVFRSGAIGLLTTLLPCGWLYTFVITAGGTGNAITGAAVMAVFWLGTVPLLLAVGLGAQFVGRPLARHMPLAGAAIVFVLGVLSLAGKLHQVPSIGHIGATAHPHGVHVVR